LCHSEKYPLESEKRRGVIASELRGGAAGYRLTERGEAYLPILRQILAAPSAAGFLIGCSAVDKNYSQ